MCVNYVTVSRELLHNVFDTVPPQEAEWKGEIFQDYLAPIIVAGAEGSRAGLLAAYSMVPKQHIRTGTKRYTTMNARAETVGELISYSKAWKNSQLCLVPMHAFFEPSWETGAAIRWKIGMADESPFAVAGLYREWKEKDGSTTFAFTQLTINADDHPLMSRFHRPDDEKRSLVIVEAAEYDDYLNCKDPEHARSWLNLYPAERMVSSPAPIIRTTKSKSVTGLPAPTINPEMDG